MKDMLGRGEALPPGTALVKLLAAIANTPPPGPVTLPLEEAYGRVLAQDILCPEEVPSFSRSTVDGYALSARDTFGASATMPAYLNIKGEVNMGEAPAFLVARGEAAKVHTGGMLPEGADAVLMFEHAGEAGGGLLEVFKPLAPGENVIHKGEDARAGEPMLGKGHRLRPQDVAALAGAGITEVPVYERPLVSIMTTGDEIAPAGERPLRPGFVRDMNSYTLQGLILEDGAVPVREGIFKDDYETLKEAFAKALSGSRMVLVTGGSSVGARDYTARLVESAGQVLFHGVAMKPGKPLIGGISRDGKPVFGLPGHPAAAAVCFEVFVRPVLRRISGEIPGSGVPGLGTPGLGTPDLNNGFRDRCSVTARLTRDVPAGGGRDQYVRVSLFERDGETWAEPVTGPSGLIRTLVKADGAFLVPAGRAGAHKGELVQVKLF